MAVYVDELRDYAHVKGAAARFGTRWCHMYADPDSAEDLHRIATQIGMRRSWFQHGDSPHWWRRHYDLVPSKRAAAVRAGAVEVKALEHMRKILAERETTKTTAQLALGDRLNLGHGTAVVVWAEPTESLISEREVALEIEDKVRVLTLRLDSTWKVSSNGIPAWLQEPLAVGDLVTVLVDDARWDKGAGIVTAELAEGGYDFTISLEVDGCPLEFSFRRWELSPR